jgi:hypothetical protein
MKADTKILNKNGYEDDPPAEEATNEELSAEEGKVFRRLAARLNYMAQDNIFLKFAPRRFAGICRGVGDMTS